MKHPRWHSCNVLQVGALDAQLWQFESDNGLVEIKASHRQPPTTPFPPRLASRDWQSIWRGKLNIAWLASDQVFVRVLQLPACDSTELLSMVELQLEKISPLPVNQIVWSVELVPRPPDKRDLQTVIAIIVARDRVEEFLGNLETRGYLADRLELPLLHQLLTTEVTEDGAWVYLHQGQNRATGLVAWWYGGVLQNVDILLLSEGEDRAIQLGEQLAKMAWAGEIEGWLSSPPQWHLIADTPTTEAWEPILREWTGEPVVVIPALPPEKLAALSAQRATQSSSKANLLPTEYSTRYRQELIDRLWMRGLGVIIGIYLIGVLGYFAAVKVFGIKLNRIETELASLSPSYTNALELKAKVDILQEQINLKFAALDCWKAASELLPADLTLLNFAFQGGRTLSLQGTVPADAQNKVTEYNTELKKTAFNGSLLFSSVDPPSLSMSPGTAASADPMARWMFKCELNRSDIP